METIDLSTIPHPRSAESAAVQRSVTQVFDDSAHRHPDRIALRAIASGETPEWTYAELAEQVAATSGAFGDLEVGARVVLALPSGADFVAGFLAVLRAGGLPVPIYLPSLKSPQRYLARAHHVLRDCEPAAVYTIPELTDAVAQEPGTADIPVRTPADGGTAVPPVSRRPEDPAFLQYSSGSTGHPKGVVNTHVSILRQIEMITRVWRGADHADGPDPIHTVSWLPLYHDMGMFWGALGPLLTGGCATLIAPHDFVRDPRIWLETVSTVRGNWIAGPDFGYRRCVQAFDAEAVAALDLSCLRIATNGAEPIRPDTVREFTEHFAPAGFGEQVMAPQYGLAEAGLGVSGALGPRHWRQADFDAAELERGRAVPVTDETAAARVRTLVGCGDSALGWDLRIVDPDSGEVLPNGRVGEIWVGGSGLPQGYWRRPEETEAVFHAVTADGSGPFLRTGDAGVRWAGELYICGRYRDLLVIGGRNHFPNDLEATAETAECGIGRGGACAVQPVFGDPSWTLVAETVRSAEDLDDLARILRRRLLADHETAPDRIVWVPPRSLPLTTSGKIRRREVVDRLMAGALTVVNESRAAAVTGAPRDDLTEYVAGLLGVRPDRLDADVDLMECGLTSMMTADVMAWAAARGSRPVFADLYRTPTLAAWRRLLERTTVPDVISEPPGAARSIPTTPLQRAYWVGRDSRQPLGGVGCQTYLEFADARLEPDRLREAVTALVHRHPMLRSRFPSAEHYVIDPVPAPVSVPVHAVTAADTEAHLEHVRTRLRNRRFDPVVGDSWAMELTVTPQTSVLHLAVDLIIADITGIGILVRDLAALYRGAELPENGAEFTVSALLEGATVAAISVGDRSISRISTVVDATTGSRKPVGGEEGLAQTSLPEPPQLPQATEQTIEFRRRRHTLSSDLVAALDQACRSAGVTRAALLLACYDLVLQRWSTRSTFLVTVTTFGRTPETARTVGDFTEARLHRCTAAPGKSWADLIRDTQRALRTELDAPDATAVLRAESARGGGHSGLSPIVFTYAADIPLLDEPTTETLGAVREVTSMTPQVLIDNQICTIGSELVMSWDHRYGCFPPGVVDDMFDTYTGLLQQLASGDWNEPALVGLPEHSRRTRARRNATEAPLPDGLLHDGFRQQALAAPHRIAVRWQPDEYDGDEVVAALVEPRAELGYGELDRYARAVAATVSAEHPPGSVVAVQLPKGPAQIVAVLGVLMAGCTYLPISVDQPAERLARIRQRSGMRALIRAEADAENADTEGVARYSLTDMLAREPGEPIPVDPAQPAYVVYTSGSTGEPKGVVVSHTAALNTVLDVNRRNGIDHTDTVLAVSALDFDLSVYDIFGLLGCGATIVTISEGARRDAFRWRDLVRSFGVTVWNSVPGLMEMLLIAARSDGAALSSLRRVLLSGDWIPLDLPGRLAELVPGTRLVAMGGATEAAIWSNEYVVETVDPDWPSVPYGFPLTNQMYRVVGEDSRDQPDHVPGELWIGGAGVALGYHNAPELSAARFLVDDTGIRWYLAVPRPDRRPGQDPRTPGGMRGSGAYAARPPGGRGRGGGAHRRQYRLGWGRRACRDHRSRRRQTAGPSRAAVARLYGAADVRPGRCRSAQRERQSGSPCRGPADRTRAAGARHGDGGAAVVRRRSGRRGVGRGIGRTDSNADTDRQFLRLRRRQSACHRGMPASGTARRGRCVRGGAARTTDIARFRRRVRSGGGCRPVGHSGALGTGDAVPADPSPTGLCTRRRRTERSGAGADGIRDRARRGRADRYPSAGARDRRLHGRIRGAALSSRLGCHPVRAGRGRAGAGAYRRRSRRRPGSADVPPRRYRPRLAHRPRGAVFRAGGGTEPYRAARQLPRPGRSQYRHGGGDHPRRLRRHRPTHHGRRWCRSVPNLRGNRRGSRRRGPGASGATETAPRARGGRRTGRDRARPLRTPLFHAEFRGVPAASTPGGR
jgi:amino acid adenylation domain-containing protein